MCLFLALFGPYFPFFVSRSPMGGKSMPRGGGKFMGGDLGGHLRDSEYESEPEEDDDAPLGSTNADTGGVETQNDTSLAELAAEDDDGAADGSQEAADLHLQPAACGGAVTVTDIQKFVLHQSKLIHVKHLVFDKKKKQGQIRKLNMRLVGKYLGMLTEARPRTHIQVLAKDKGGLHSFTPLRRYNLSFFFQMGPTSPWAVSTSRVRCSSCTTSTRLTRKWPKTKSLTP
jgi:hypothetical protein